jgi:hypothetical protein
MPKPKNIESPDKLWELFEAYKKQEQQNPMYKVDYVGKDGNCVDTPLQVPYTFEGFELYLAELNIIQDLGDYSSNKGGRYSEYATIITRIKKNCFVQNYKGAAVGLFNANLIKAKLGIADRKEIEHSGGLNIPNLPDIGTRK